MQCRSARLFCALCSLGRSLADTVDAEGEDKLELRRRKWKKAADSSAGTLGDQLWPATVTLTVELLQAIVTVELWQATVTVPCRGWRRRGGRVGEGALVGEGERRGRTGS